MSVITTIANRPKVLMKKVSNRKARIRVRIHTMTPTIMMLKKNLLKTVAAAATTTAVDYPDRRCSLLRTNHQQK